MDTVNFTYHVKRKDIYKDVGKGVETRLGTLNFELDRLLAKTKIKKVIGLMKDELEAKIKKEFFGLRAKAYSYLKDYNDENKNPKGTKKLDHKRKLKFQDYKNCLDGAQIGNK